MSGDGLDDLVARAKERAEASPLPGEWGYRVSLDPEESFVGRWRGTAVDEQNDGRAIYLFWDADGQRCFSRTYAALAREIDRVEPSLGCSIVVVRGADYVGRQGTGYAFGVETEANEAPLPADVSDDDQDEDEPAQVAPDDDVPY